MRRIRLGDHACTQSGGTPSRSNRSYYEGSIPWFKSGELKDGLLNDSEEHISEAALADSSAKLVPSGTLLMAMYGATVGRLGVLSRSAATNQAICAIQPSEALDRDFLFYTLLDARPALIETSFGGAQPNISQEVIREIRIPLPDLPTQRRIAARLKEQMAGVEAARKAVEEQQRAVTPLFEKLLSEAFSGITPLSLGINPDPAPPGWEWRRLMDVARLESGHTPSRRHPEYWENGDIPWLALPDIRALDCRVALETSEKTNALGIANSSARLLPENTVALCRTASVGCVTILGREMATTQHFANWLCGETIHHRFLMWLFRCSRRFIRSQAVGAVLPDVYMNVIHNFYVCLPNLSVQSSIAARLDEAFEQTESLRAGLGKQMEAVSALPAAYLRASFEAVE